MVKHTDHNCSSVRIGGEILAGNDSANAALAVGLLLTNDESLLLRIILKNTDSSRIGANDQIVDFTL